MLHYTLLFLRNTDMSSGAIASWSINPSSLAITTASVGHAEGWWAVAQGDFNGDGSQDIIFRDAHGHDAEWQMNGSSIWVNQGIGGKAVGWNVAAVGDFNGDGTDDLIWRDHAHMNMWKMSAFSDKSVHLPDISTSWHVGGVGDFNKDGKDDIFFFKTNGDTEVWTMNGSGRSSAHASHDLAAHVRPIAIGDFDGDGRDEILVRNSHTNEVRMWEMKGSKMVSSKHVTGIDKNWSVEHVVDVNHDGKDDIIWRGHGAYNTHVAIWEMNGAHVLLNSGLGTVNDGWMIL